MANVLLRAVVRDQTPRFNEDGGPRTVVTPGGEERPIGNEFRKHAKTDGTGKYEMKGLPAGALAVVAVREGTRVPVQRFTAVEGGTVTANFVLPDQGLLTLT